MADDNQFAVCSQSQSSLNSQQENMETSVSSNISIDSSTVVETEAERFARVCAAFYANDWVICEVLKYLKNPKERHNIELSSRRLYTLSRKTPCSMGYTIVRVSVNFYEEDEDEHFIKISVEGKSGSYFKILEDFEFSRPRHVLGDLLRVIGQRYEKNIYRVSINGVLELDTLEVLDLHYIHLTELYSHGFTDETLKFLNSPECAIAKRILKLGFFDFIVPPEWKNRCLIPFQSLRSLSLKVWHGWPIKLFIKNLREIQKMENISIRNSCSYYKETTSNECPNFSKLEDLCEKIKFCDQNVLAPATQINVEATKNITHLELWLWGAMEKQIIKFFKAVPLDKFETVSLNRLTFTTGIISTICSNRSENPVLRNLQIDGVFDSTTSNQSLFKICPPSLESLTIKQCVITLKDMEMLPTVCPKLKDFYCVLGLGKDENTENIRRSAIDGINFGRAIKKVTTLERLLTRLRVEPDFLITLCVGLPHIVKAQFSIHRIKCEPTIVLLKKYFKVVKITKDPYILDFEKIDERTQKTKMKILFTSRETHAMMSYWERCKSWHIVVEGRRETSPDLPPPDLTDIAVYNGLCFCDNQIYLL